MSLSLIDPLSSNFLRDFPGQNAVNLDEIDDRAGPSLATHGLRSFVPALSATTTAPNIGGAGSSNLAYYYKIWDHVYCWGQFVFGTGFSAGSGTYTVGIPFEVDNVIGTSTSLGQCPVIGQGWINDASAAAARVPVTVHYRQGNQLMFGLKLTSGSGARDLRDSGFITWAVGDGVAWSAQFKVISS